LVQASGALPPAYPGSALRSIEGEPAAIVYGTRGSDVGAPRDASRGRSGEQERESSWLDDSGDKGADGVPHSQNLYAG